MMETSDLPAASVKRFVVRSEQLDLFPGSVEDKRVVCRPVHGQPQAQVLALMENLKTKLDTAILLITHDLGVVAQVCDRVIVMYAGRIIEQAPVSDLFKRPQHPYTKALLESIPKAGRRTPDGRLPTIAGIVPSLFELPKGCRFQDRCGYATQNCIDNEPDLIMHDFADRPVRCHTPLNQKTDLTTGASG